MPSARFDVRWRIFCSRVCSAYGATVRAVIFGGME